MKMNELIRYGIPPKILALWRECESDTLLPLQEMAVKRYGLFEAGNLLVQAPTSAGKTFIGEMAAIQAALRRKKVLYLVPLKALAEEKFRDFSEKYSPYGLRVIISTRDRREFDRYLEDGDFSIAVVVYEKLAQLLVRRPERIEEIALVVADELEILSDSDRGGMAEVLLTRILYPPERAGAGNRPRLLGLSAVIGQAEKLAEWLQAALIAYDRRPVELRYGVLYEGVFRYRTYNDCGEGEEKLLHAGSESPWDTLMENVHAFVEQGEACLVFVKAKHESRRGAELLAAHIRHAPARRAIDALRRLEPTRSRDALLETLNNGVAFHNANLSPEERRVVEQGFREGEIMAVVSTSTLALGMNLPARNAFIAAEKWRYDKRFGMPWKTPILHGEYENMGGRAGRYGAGHDFGRAILIASTPFDQETLWRRYVEGERECVEPQLAREPLENILLRLAASRTCRTGAELQYFLEHTLTGQWVWMDTLTREECEFRIQAALNRAADAGVLTLHPDGRVEATPFGLAIAAKGVSIATARELEHWLAESETRRWSPIDLILAAAMTTDGRMLQVSLTAREYEHADYPGRLKRLTQGEDIAADVPLNRIRNCNLTPFFEEVRAIKTALFLSEWLEHASLHDLEETYHVMAGQILAAADQLAWLIDAAAAIAASLGAGSDFVDRITAVSARVQCGLREEVLPLARAGGRRFSRNVMLTLVAHRLHTAEALDKTPIDVLTAWMPAGDARALKTWAQGALHAVEDDESPIGDSGAGLNGPPARTAEAPVLVVNDRQPGEILLDGERIRLQEKQYRLIRTLAAAPGECVPYDAIYEAVWGDTIVEPNQMHFQKRKLLDAVKERLARRADLVTTVPKRGFVLNLTPEDVLVVTPESSRLRAEDSNVFVCTEKRAILSGVTAET